jgi:hypothetical protein
MVRVMTRVTTMTKDTITKCSFFEDFLPTWIRQSSHTISKLFWVIPITANMCVVLFLMIGYDTCGFDE